MLEFLPATILGIGFYLYMFKSDLSEDYSFIFTFLSLLFVPLSLFTAGAVAEANSAGAVANLMHNFAWGMSLLWCALIGLHIGNALLESLGKTKQINLNTRVRM